MVAAAVVAAGGGGRGVDSVGDCVLLVLLCEEHDAQGWLGAGFPREEHVCAHSDVFMKSDNVALWTGYQVFGWMEGRFHREEHARLSQDLHVSKNIVKKCLGMFLGLVLSRGTFDHK